MLSLRGHGKFTVATDDGRPVVQVLFARAAEQTIVEIEFEPGMTAAAAVERSGLVEDLRVLSTEDLVLGVWGVEVDPECAIRAGDRVELSRPLQADPRDMRRELMTDGRVMGGAPAPDAGSRKKARK